MAFFRGFGPRRAAVWAEQPFFSFAIIFYHHKEHSLRVSGLNSKIFLNYTFGLDILRSVLTVIISNHNVIFIMTSSLEESKPSCSSSIRHRKQRKHFDYIRSNSLFSLFDIPSSSLSSLWTFCYFRENGCLFFMRTLYISWVSETPPSS